MSFHFINFFIRQNDKVFKLTTDSLVLAGLTKLHGDENVLDVGTGTGVIALLLKDRFPGIEVEAIDINPESVSLASENFQSFYDPSGLRVSQGSIDSSPPKSYDLIIANPPYFQDSLTSPQEWKTQAKHTSDWDWTTFFKESRKRLDPKGKIAIILPFSALEDIHGLANYSSLHLTRLTKVSDQAHTPIKLVRLEFQKKVASYVEDHLILKDGDGSFSTQYKSVLRGWVQW